MQQVKDIHTILYHTLLLQIATRGSQCFQNSQMSMNVQFGPREFTSQLPFSIRKGWALSALLTRFSVPLFTSDRNEAQATIHPFAVQRTGKRHSRTNTRSARNVYWGKSTSTNCFACFPATSYGPGGPKKFEKMPSSLYRYEELVNFPGEHPESQEHWPHRDACFFLPSTCFVRSRATMPHGNEAKGIASSLAFLPSFICLLRDLSHCLPLPDQERSGFSRMALPAL